MVTVVVIVAALVATLVIVAIRAIIVAKRAEHGQERLPPPLLYPVSAAARIGTPAAGWPLRAGPARTSAPVSRPMPSPVTRVPDQEPNEPLSESSTVHFRRPVEHAVQLLPGRLEVLAGESRHKEIRLMRVPGKRAEVILGRDRIESPGHVALQSSTVSRRHARLAFTDGVWKVANLSQTNPVVVNDEALPAHHERALDDGDRLELGEVVLRFHAR